MLKCVVMPGAKEPEKKHKGDAGWDIFTAQNYVINPRERIVVNTGILVSCPDTIYFRIADKSAVASKLGLHVFAGVIDSNYRGQVKVLVYNPSSRTISIKKHFPIAQIIPTVICNEPFYIVDKLDTSVRGEAGGINNES